MGPTTCSPITSALWCPSSTAATPRCTSSAIAKHPVAERRDRPFGQPRLTSGIGQTDRGFTGQRSLAGAGLQDFNARWFDTSLGGFASPDSLIPDPFSPQSLNRYGYALNSPLRYTDPTGHRACDDEDAAGRCVTAPPVQIGTTRYTTSTIGRTITLTPAQPPPPVDYTRSQSLSQTEQRRNEPVSTDQVTALLDTRLREIYDPWNIPGSEPYESSVYYGLDQIAAGAYGYYGVDLNTLAEARIDNPLSQGMLAEYVESGGWEAIDPRTGEEVDIYMGLVFRIQSGFSSDVYRDVLFTIGAPLTVGHGMNYERNYLAALFQAHPLAVERSRQAVAAALLETYGRDPVAFWDTMLQLDLTGE